MRNRYEFVEGIEPSHTLEVRQRHIVLTTHAQMDRMTRVRSRGGRRCHEICSVRMVHHPNSSPRGCGGTTALVHTCTPDRLDDNSA